MDPDTLRALGNLSGPAIMIAIILAGARGYWIWGWAHKEEMQRKDEIITQCRKDSDYYRDIAFRVTKIAERSQTTQDIQTGQTPWDSSDD